jgi:hypothetical protein
MNELTSVQNFSESFASGDLRAALCAVGREFHSRGWSLGTSSNYSVVTGRNPLELLITASGKDKSALTRDDFLAVDSAGHLLQDHGAIGRKSSAETLLHCLIAKSLPDVVFNTVISEEVFDVSCLFNLPRLSGNRDYGHRYVLLLFFVFVCENSVVKCTVRAVSVGLLPQTETRKSQCAVEPQPRFDPRCRGRALTGGIHGVVSLLTGFHLRILELLEYCLTVQPCPGCSGTRARQSLCREL